MIYALMVLLLVVPLLVEKRRDNRRAICIYSGINAAHALLPTFDNGLVYYGGCALTDLIILTLLFWFVGNKLAKSLMMICIISIVVNISGFGLWVSYRQMDVYNVASSMVYVIALVVMLLSGRYDTRCEINHTGRNNLHPDTGSGGANLHGGKESKG